jgi:dienelactone hydrolase
MKASRDDAATPPLLQSARGLGRVDEIAILASDALLVGTLALPAGAEAVVLFAHGSGSSRFSPRNRMVAGRLNEAGLGTLLLDLLTAEEQQIDERTGALRFDIALLTRRLTGTVDALARMRDTRGMRTGLFGASTGAAAALATAAERPGQIAAVVSRGGRPDLALPDLPRVRAPTLLIVGGLDRAVIGMNRQAAAQLSCEHRLEIVPGATHLFEERGALEQVAQLAADWFLRHLRSPSQDA